MKKITNIKISKFYILLIIIFISLSLIVYAGGGGGRRGGGGPPPPPPPCPIQSAGCYKIGDVKANFGEISPNEFAYYLSENICKRSGGCDCRGVPEDIIPETNPDDSSGACNCIAGTDWNAKARCCGDDVTDCGKISSGVLCSIDANAESASWVASTPNLGDIRYVGCARVEYLSDGNNWVKCDGTFWRKTISNSEYICIGRGRESIVECCGDGSCKSRVDGKRLTTGQFINPSELQNTESVATFSSPIGLCVLLNLNKNPSCNTESTNADCVCESSETKKESFEECKTVTETVCTGSGEDEICQPQEKRVCSTKYKCVSTKGIQCGGREDIRCPARYFCKKSFATNTITGNVVAGDTKTYYCRSDRKFVTDLDVSNSQINDKALIGKNKATCEKAGFTWTGTKCCSEDDDKEEYYNDPKGIGGCWDKKSIISVNFVEGTDNSVVNYNGELHGCAIDKTNFNKNNDNLLSLADKHTGGPLITNHDYCFNDPEKNYYCSYTEKWLPTDGTNKSHVSFAPIKNPKQVADCCAANECWDGSACIENQRNNPLAQPINGFRCIDGEWTQSELRVTVDQGVSGYCPKKSQCLANVFGKTESSQCLESGEYFDDNYCEEGVWSTRTKLLALKLLKLKSGDFTLFCDNRENTLNNLQYLTDSNEVVANTLTNLKTNNFCVLKTGSKIIAATSINKNLEEIPANTLNIFGVTSCEDALINDGQYHSCDATKKVWFNKRLKSFIYSASAITIPSEQEPLSSFEEFIGNPIKNIIDSIKRLVTTPPFDDSYVKGIKKFDKLYVTQLGNKAIIGSIEGKDFKNAVIEYRNFEINICKFVEQFSQAKKDVSSGISCKKEGNNYYVLAQGSQFTSINPEAIWSDLTAKLRLK